MNPIQPAEQGVAAIEEKRTPVCGDTPPGAAIPSGAVEDADDLAAARAGDDAAFGRLYGRHAPVVLSLCRKRSMAEAEDAAQETFIRAHKLLHKVKSAEALRPWLFGIARRVCSERTRSARRRARHEERFAVSRAAAHTAPGTAAGEPQPGAAAAHAEQLELLGDALQQLDDRERLAIHLYYLEADPVGAATSALGLSRSGYYKLLSRARGRLADLINCK